MSITILTCLTLLASAAADAPLFQDDFRGGLGEGWSWVREHPEAWRTTDAGLEILLEPGNMWGGANDARNVLVRPLPEIEAGALRIALTVSNDPIGQYEQIDLVWYYDDSRMVKIGLERVDGQNSLVMGREERDKTRTLAIIPVESTTLDVRLTVRGKEITGEFREAPDGAWQIAGACDLPAKGKPHASIQAYQGLPTAEHWARVTGFRVERVE
ncbi:MAG: hypothetical protein GC168_08950 [Candidatus Hydrogenedens sp.]|nr:hypothetical protein [Candidatus Hydrogenedens sp.]